MTENQPPNAATRLSEQAAWIRRLQKKVENQAHYIADMINEGMSQATTIRAQADFIASLLDYKATADQQVATYESLFGIADELKRRYEAEISQLKADLYEVTARLNEVDPTGEIR